MVEKKLTEAQAAVSKHLSSSLNVTLIKHDYFDSKLANMPPHQINEHAVLQIVYNAPIEEVSHWIWLTFSASF